MTDMVNHPPHYTAGNVECIDAIKASMMGACFLGYLKGQVLKYMWRYEKKSDPVEDLKKARFYLDRMISELEGDEDGREEAEGHIQDGPGLSRGFPGHFDR